MIMKLFISVKPRAKEERVEKIDEAHFLVAVKEPPVQGRANTAVIKALADFLGVPRSRLCIVAGHANRQKTIEIS